MTNPYRHQVKDLIRDGVRPSEIAARAGVTPSVIARWLRAETGMDSAEWRAAHGWVGNVAPDKVNEALQIWGDDHTLTRKTLAEKCNLTPSQVAAIFRAHTPEPHQHHQPAPTDPDTINTIITAYQSGHTTVALAAQYNVDPITIRRILEAHHIDRRPRGGGPRPLTAKQRADILTAWENTHTVKATAATVHIARDRVAQALDDANIHRLRRPADSRTDDELRPLLLAAYTQRPTINHAAITAGTHWLRAHRILRDAGALPNST